MYVHLKHYSRNEIKVKEVKLGKNSQETKQENKRKSDTAKLGISKKCFSRKIEKQARKGKHIGTEWKTLFNPKRMKNKI